MQLILLPSKKYPTFQSMKDGWANGDDFRMVKGPYQFCSIRDLPLLKVICTRNLKESGEVIVQATDDIDEAGSFTVLKEK